MRFLPSLRTKSLPIATGELVAASPAVPGGEFKTVLANYYNALASSGAWTPHRARPWPVERAVVEGYERIVWVFKAVEAISASAARLPFQLKDGEQIVEDHPLYEVLNKQANPIETGRQFRKRLCAQILLSKAGAFVEVTRSRAGEIVRMDLLPPGRTRPVPGSGQVLIDHFEVTRADGARQKIDPDNVRWFRDPHPTDPYSGVTPLESAGMSVELDFFARLYNVAFLKNDGRPAGVLGIDGEMDQVEMDRIESRFPGGPTEAGKLSVINGKVTYTDLATRPRDMQYELLAASTKIEILSSFGVPESVIGYSADRTYANAEQELYNFWTVTMPPFLDLLSTGFDEDTEDELECGFDTTTVEVLQRPEIARRAEAREEFDKGLISPDEYRERAGYDRIDRPETRALYIASGKQPIPASEEDAAEMGLDQDSLEAERQAELAAQQEPPEEEEPAPADGGQGAQQPSGGTKPPAPGTGGSSPPATSAGARRTASQTKHLQAVAGGPAAPPALPAPTPAPVRPVMRLVRSRQVKTAASAAQTYESDPDEEARDALEERLTAELAALTERLIERTLARLESPKQRKGTRHWSPDPALTIDLRIGTKALDAPRAVDEERWEQEAQDAARQEVSAAVAAAAAALAAELGGAPGTPGWLPRLRKRLESLIADVLLMIGGSIRRQAEALAALINESDQRGLGLAAIKALVRGRAGRLAAWAAGIAAQAATAAISGARENAAQALYEDDPGADIVRVWRSRRDERVRHSHDLADGQTQPLASPFVVGGALLRFPGDPLGPPQEVYNCRCVLNYRSRTSGRYTAPPSGALARV